MFKKRPESGQQPLCILVLCTGNSCRSQMAHGFLQHFGAEKVKVFSAGVEKHGLNPFAVGIMAEIGIDISQHTSNSIDDYKNTHFDLVLTVCDHAKETCPWFPTDARLIHHSFRDPSASSGTAKELVAEFRAVRDEIGTFCRRLLENELSEENR